MNAHQMTWSYPSYLGVISRKLALVAFVVGSTLRLRPACAKDPQA